MRIGEWITKHRPSIIDITGGAPELNDNFKYLVETSRAAGSHVIDRNNLTIIEEPGFEWLPKFLANNEIEIVASLPCYEPENVTRQRGNGVFDKSITALQKLNALGYGSILPLNLVYNPVGANLPPSQPKLEADYRKGLKSKYDITFTNLYTLTNQPIARFAEELRLHGKWHEYIDLLANSFNPATIEGLMCRNTLSVDHKGRLYDCDFNQMLDLGIGNGEALYLWEIEPEFLNDHPIQNDYHCLACTAGSGSSCTGKTV